MKLYLVRHADYKIEAQKEEEKVLSNKGQEDMSRIVDFLMPQHISVQVILHSTKVRARQTAEILSAAVSSIEGLREDNGLCPNEEIDFWEEELSCQNEDIMIVGHLPFLGILLSRLTTGHDHFQAIDFQPGSIICLEKVGIGKFIIEWIINAEFV